MDLTRARPHIRSRTNDYPVQRTRFCHLVTVISLRTIVHDDFTPRKRHGATYKPSVNVETRHNLHGMECLIEHSTLSISITPLHFEWMLPFRE
ncbi:hypothetical protein AVEN_185354-1 [Araneus ventricosus]|uniref:Uncharacterized protein n=1 Tax=Araneus ventricosus TaxID=182803 RepID=A0A4Y2HRB4_ARAVE|nr:hypothetical protein AVEN_185354-1 [Araneus ventricosus]